MAIKATSVTEINNLVFIGREYYKQKFWLTVQNHARQEEQHHVLVYYGIGGIGKSRLQEHLINELTDPVHKNFLIARVNLADLITTTDAATILYHLRAKLRQADPSIPFPRFDFAYLVYYAKINAVAKTQSNGFLQSMHIDILTPAAQSFISQTLVSGALGTISAIIGKADESVKKWWDKNRYPELELFHTLEAIQMVEQLSEFLASDLNAYLTKNTLKHPIFFFDTLENLIWKTRDEYYQYTHDQWLRNLIIDLPKVTWVICGREPLLWETLHTDEEWAGSIYSYELKELLIGEADELLKFYKITDLPIQQKIKDASQCHPLYLNLSIATYQLITKDRQPKAEDFGSTFQQIYERFIRHLTQAEADTFKILSCLQNWDASLLDLLLKEFNQAYHSPRAMLQISRFSFVSKSNTGYTYTLHQLMRDHLYEQFNRELPTQVIKVHQFCFDFFHQQLNETVEIENKKGLILKGFYHMVKIQTTNQVYEWINDQLSTFDVAIHFEFIIQMLTPLYEVMLVQSESSNLLTTAHCIEFLGIAYENKSQYDQAEKLYQKALLIRQQVLGEKHPATASSYNHLAEIIHRQGRYDQAEPLSQKALQIRQQVLGEIHLDTAHSYNHHAELLKGQGRYDQAESLYQKALNIQQQVLGEINHDTATSYNNLAGLLQIQGKYDQSEVLYRKAIRIKQQSFGEDHRSTALSYNHLAVLLEKQGKYDQAKELYEKAIQIQQNILGEEHPELAMSYHNLGAILKNQGNYDQAESLYQKALNILQKVLGENHPDTATSYNNLAVLLKSQGKYEQAQLLYWKAIKIKQQILGERHPELAMSYHNLAGLLEAQGNYDQAEALYEKAIDIKQKVLGEDHPSIAISYNNLAGLLKAQGKYIQAELFYRKALKINENKLGYDHKSTKTVRNNLYQLLEQMGK